MRYLRRQVINRRAPYDQRLTVDVNNNVIISSPGAVQLPTSDTAARPITSARYGTTDTADLSGMIRYNTQTDEFEGYQNGTWRAFRFKESVGIIRQYLGEGDATNVVFGPLNPAPPSTVDENLAWAASGNLTTPGNTWTGANLIVIVGNVFQIYGENYNVLDGGDPSLSGELDQNGNAVVGGNKYIVFDSSVPASIPGSLVKVYAFHGFDR